MTLGERMKQIRKESGLTLDKFGEKIGLKKAVLSQFERGTANPSDRTILSICREFNIREAWLRTGEGEKFVPKQTGEELERFFSEVTFETPGFRRAFLTMLSRLTPQEWEILARKAEELAEDMKKKPDQ